VESQISILPEGLSSNEVFPHFILNELPLGLKGLLIAAILAAAMSSLDSAMTALSNTIVIDFLHSNKSTEDASILKSAKKWVIVVGICGTVAAIFCSRFDASLLTMALSVTGLFTGPLLAMFVLAFYMPHLNSQSVFYSAIAGMFTLAYFSPPKFARELWEPVQSFSWPWFPFIAFTATISYALFLSLFWKRQENREC
jgi:solute:Na+ symporter, SSS family